MIVATAGHVDHGKTTLVKALTGIDTDRLETEKARGMSIMTWVKVTGKATFPIVGGQRMPLIENGVIEKTDPPQDTFLY